MRLFVSIDVPDELASAVDELQEEFADADGLRFTDPTGVHVTLKFLGEVEEERLPELASAIGAAVDESGVGPFEAEFGGLGVFPSMEYVSVVWVGVREGGDEMTRLHEAVERRTVAMGFEPESHEFTPHVTLARMDHAGGKELVQRLVRERDPIVGRTTVDEVRLTESELGPDGPSYSTVERLPL
jgi:RNA 2',3'-cyclic 3'-phosphodiesterase